MRILGISGSLRRDSLNSKLLRAAVGLLPPGAELVMYHGLKAIPPFDADDEGSPDASVLELREAIAHADAVLIATPEFNSSVPGVLKNALDWASRPKADAALMNKPAAVVGASTGMFGAVWAQADARKVLSATGARVVDRDLPVGNADSAFDGDGRLADPDLRAELRGILAELHATADERQATLARAA